MPGAGLMVAVAAATGSATMRATAGSATMRTTAGPTTMGDTAPHRAVGDAAEVGPSARREMGRGRMTSGKLWSRATREGAAMKRTRPTAANETVRNRSGMADETAPRAIGAPDRLCGAEPTNPDRPTGAASECRDRPASGGHIRRMLRTTEARRNRGAGIGDAATVSRIMDPSAVGKGRMAWFKAAEDGVIDDDAAATPVESTPTPERTEHRDRKS